jgi:hypothetical protein
VAQVTVRVYGPLNDFLPHHQRQSTCSRAVPGSTTVKDLVEGLGVPHPEIDLIVVNGNSAPFDYVVQPEDRIAVFPRFMTLDISALTRVRPPPLEPIQFVADVHLGKLARHLRLIGLDTTYRPDADDAELADAARCEGRILLTRDQGLLKRRVVTHGCFIRATRPHDQLVEVLRQFGPLTLAPFSRCLRCNTELREIRKQAVDSALQPQTRQHYNQFKVCAGCGRIYWKGSHWKRLVHAIDAALDEANTISPTPDRDPRCRHRIGLNERQSS